MIAASQVAKRLKTNSQEIKKFQGIPWTDMN